MSQNKKEEKKEEKSSKEGGNSFSQSIEVAKQVKELMKDFYKEESSSSIDFFSRQYMNAVLRQHFKQVFELKVDFGGIMSNNCFSKFSSKKFDEERIFQKDNDSVEEVLQTFLNNLTGVISDDQHRQMLTFFKNHSHIISAKGERLFQSNQLEGLTFIRCYLKKTRNKVNFRYNVVILDYQLTPNLLQCFKARGEDGEDGKK